MYMNARFCFLKNPLAWQTAGRGRCTEGMFKVAPFHDLGGRRAATVSAGCSRLFHSCSNLGFKSIGSWPESSGVGAFLPLESPNGWTGGPYAVGGGCVPEISLPLRFN
uniref:Uncharacterized protein n=1 Tax=Trypanosoma vivax (strain Y486) TaxID=1055687 RepID=G0U2V9_TRYVY|nr:hypothetical protein TVY486_0904340 [Trypanosoma vivax Y486]